MKRLWLIACGVLMFSLAGQMNPVAASSEKPVIGISVMMYDNPFFIALKDGAKEGVEAVGGELIEHDSRSDVARQIEGVENFVAQKVDAILLNAFDRAALIPAVLSANDANIPVITVDTTVSGGKITTSVTSDNLSAGKLCAEYMVARLKKDKGKEAGNIVILEGFPSTAVLQRVQGFREVIAQYPDIKVIATANAEGNLEVGVKVMEKILLEQKSIDCVFAINDPSAAGALMSIEAANRQQEMFIVAVDGAKIALEAIKRGSAFAFTAAQDPVAIGRIGVEQAIKVLKGETLPPEILVPVHPISIENVDDYLPKARF